MTEYTTPSGPSGRPEAEGEGANAPSPGTVKTLPAFIQRMEIEADELHTKIMAASSFRDTDLWMKLDRYSQFLLHSQIKLMMGYHEVLTLRIQKAIRSVS